MNRPIPVLSLLLFSVAGFAQLGNGSLLFIGFNADSTDGFAVVTMDSIPPNSTIYFSDNEWNGQPMGSGGAFNNLNEGELVWHTDSTGISPCTAILFNHVSNSSHTNYGSTVGTIRNQLSLSGSNEVVYCYLGSDSATPTTFLSAIGNDGFNFTNGTLDQTGLHEGVNAVAILGDKDVAVYSDSSSCNGKINCTSMIVNSSNWSSQNGTGNQASDGVFPDFPSDVITSFGSKVLPVEFVNVQAIPEEHFTRVKWKTASEINSAYFQVQYYMHNQWFDIGEQTPAAGYSSIPIEYEVNRTIPVQATSVRIQEVDFDGSVQYSDITSINRHSPQERFQAYCNGKESIQIQLPVNLIDPTIQIIDASGGLTQLIVPQKRGHQLVRVQPGLYWVVLKSDRFMDSKLIFVH